MSDDELVISGIEVSSIYFCVNQFLLLCLTIYVYLTEEHKNIKEFLKTIWKRKWIYGEVTAHLYDTASDIGVLVDWYRLANDGNDYNINMQSMFWVSIAFHIWYRFILCCFTTVAFGGQSSYDDSCCDCMGKIGLSCIDMSIIKTVYVSLKHGEMQPSARQESIGIIEALTESAPQVILIH